MQISRLSSGKSFIGKRKKFIFNAISSTRVYLYTVALCGGVLMQYCAIPLSPVVWSVFARRRGSLNAASSSALPEEQQLFMWEPQKVGQYQIILRPYTLNPGSYRFEAKVNVTVVCWYMYFSVFLTVLYRILW